VLLEAWSTLRSELPHEDIRLVLIGAGHDGDKLRHLIATSGRGDILWIEEFLQDRNRLRSYLGAGDVYVFPSRHEGFPVAPIEAMACGLPIVAADARGVAEILSDGENSGGVLVPVQDARALADGLARFVADRSWCREMGARARQTVLARFSPDAVGDAFDYRPFVWTAGEGIRPLDVHPGDTRAQARAVNDEGLIVGLSRGPGGLRAVTWQCGVVSDLNDLAGGYDGQLLIANDVNDEGVITGQAISAAGTNVAFVATPTDS